jgi:hypothetical protein
MVPAMIRLRKSNNTFIDEISFVDLSAFSGKTLAKEVFEMKNLKPNFQNPEK